MDILDTKSLLGGGDIVLRLATVCSGIDSPIFALKELKDAAIRLRSGRLFKLHHVYACELEPWKQNFLARNSKADHIYRDIMELSRPRATHA